MSLYLEVAIAAGRYLLAAEHVLEVCDAAGGLASDHGMAVIDLREVFEEPTALAGCYVLCARTSGGAVALRVDRVDGLVELGDAEFCPLPPIGPLGALIDAVSTRLAAGRPLLRLRAENAPAAAIASATNPAAPA